MLEMLGQVVLQALTERSVCGTFTTQKHSERHYWWKRGAKNRRLKGRREKNEFKKKVKKQISVRKLSEPEERSKEKAGPSPASSDGSRKRDGTTKGV